MLSCCLKIESLIRRGNKTILLLFCLLDNYNFYKFKVGVVLSHYAMIVVSINLLEGARGCSLLGCHHFKRSQL